MTFEHKMIAGLGEIKALVFECNKCNARVSLVPENIDMVPNSCPRGHAWDWNNVDDYQKVGSPFMALVHSLKRLRDPLSERVGFKIFLEFDGPKSSG